MLRLVTLKAPHYMYECLFRSIAHAMQCSPPPRVATYFPAPYSWLR